ncbi:ESX-1 secretion-associated protein EspJ [Mycobacterium tuberculosis]|nr:ESX-1 secretion-associated protein EspJ [Mycobacterium tuberculosis]
MAEPLAVDPTGLSAAAAKLAGLVFPQPPAPIAVSGTDSVVAAINETMPSIESLVSDGLPGVKAALTRTASNMNAAADVYAKTDQSLGTSLSQYAFGSSGEGLAGVASVGGQPSQATQLLSTPVSQVTTQLGETAAELAPRVVATVPQLVQLAPHAVQMSQNASPIAQTISQTAQQAAQSAQGGSGPMPAQLASAEKPATEQAEPVHEVTNDDQGDQGDVQPAEVVAAARDEGAGASPGQQPGGGVPAQAMDTGAGARPAASPLAAPSIRRLRHPQQPQRCRPGLPAAPSRTQRLLLSWPRQHAAARARSSNPVTYCQYSQSATATRWTAASVAVCAWCRAISCEWAA